MSIKIEKTTIIRLFIKQAGLDRWSKEQVARVISTEIQLPVSKSNAVLETSFEYNCYCLVYYDKINEIEADKLVQRINKKLIELHKLIHNLKLIGVKINEKGM